MKPGPMIVICMSLFIFIQCTGGGMPDAAGNVPAVDMVTVEGGTFQQYEVDAETGDVFDSFAHTISTFRIARNEVAYELWYTVYTWAVHNGYAFENPGREGNDGIDGAEPTTAKNEPVTMVSWRDVVVWCNAYSQMSGLKPVYYTEFGDVIRDSRPANDAVLRHAVADWDADGYRLPTEGEWRYAARSRGVEAAGTVEREALSYTKPVGSGRPNKLGINGTRGNVWEWCWDWRTNYPDTDVTDYRGPETGGGKITLGGQAYMCGHFQYGFRVGYIIDLVNPYQGFRVASR